MKLKRCPFCNDHDLTLEVTQVSFAIKCLSCGAIGPSTTGSKERAADWWNGEAKYQNQSALICHEGKGSNRSDLKDVDL